MATEKKKEDKARKQTNIKDLPDNTGVTEDGDKVKGGRRIAGDACDGGE